MPDEPPAQHPHEPDPAPPRRLGRGVWPLLAAPFAALSLWPPAAAHLPLLALLPVAAVGTLRGARAGVGMAAWCAGWTLLGQLRGVPADASLPIADLALALCWLPALGWATGRAHQLRRKVARRERERAEAEGLLQAAEGQSRALLEALPDFILRIDRAGKVLDFNPQSARLSHPGGDVRSGRNVSDVMPPRMATQLLEAVQQALQSTEVITFEFQEQRAAQDPPRDYEARVVRGGEHEAIAIIRDVTAIHQLTRELNEAHHSALRAAGTKGRFLATMSHQIRTPMNGVVGMTNVLLQTPLSADQQEYTTIIRNSGEALLSILDDVMDATKIETGRIQLEREEFPLRASLEEVIELLSGRAHTRGLEVASLVDARVPDWVTGDRGRLRQVVTNLLGNAIKFTERGSVTLRVTVVGHERDQAMIRFEVTDTGRGISREEQERLFQDFSQADAGIAREYGGTGLGLVISQQIVAAMGGHMAVRSDPGVGSTFAFTVRLATAYGRTTGSFLLPRALSGARLIAAPLHPLTRRALEHELSPFGAHLEVVEDHAELAEQVQAAGPFDLAVLELPLNAADDQVRTRVRAAAQAAGSLPLCVVHGIERRAVADVAREAGGALCLARPLRRTALYEGLGKLLGVSAQKPRRRGGAGSDSPSAGPLRVRVLVAEDNLVNQKVAVRTLELLGCTAEVVENGALAIDAVQQGGFDLVLMDCQMPLMDGFEATRRIRAAENGETRVPIVAMTANAMQGDRERCLAAGMDDYVAKPMTVPELTGALSRWLPERLPAATGEGRG